MKYKAYTLKNIDQHPIWSHLSTTQREAIRVVGQVFPFRTNNYILDELISYESLETDPMFILTFPQKGMIDEEAYASILQLLNTNVSGKVLDAAVLKIRKRLNPQPGNQHENIPLLNGEALPGLQHKYKETVLFFPAKGQGCHAYCTFCFRWAQFTNQKELVFASNQYKQLVEYLSAHTEVTDLLITGGDPMVMSASNFEVLIDVILDAKIEHLQTIRIGSKSLSYWPYRFVADKDSKQLLDVFKKIVKSGIHLSFMAHFNHPVEMSTVIVKKAVKRIQKTGAVIRTQAPLMNHINNRAELWLELWKKQVNMGMVPYYMFIGRNTSAQKYFGIPLDEAYAIFQEAYAAVSGLARTVRGPIMSAIEGKVLIDGVLGDKDDKRFLLKYIQGAKPEWVGKPFFAEFIPGALWLTDLMPYDTESAFFFDRKNLK